MYGISQKFWDFFQKADKWKIILFVFSGSFMLRLPTIFMDYIHVDVITTYLIVKRDIAGLAFSPNKGWLYHYLFKYSVLLFGDSPASFHFTGIIFILLTCVFIYLLGKKIYDERTGLIAAMFYGFIISSYNTEFLATNGEVIYLLFFMSSFYFFYLAVFEKRYIYTIPLAVSLILGLFIKDQASYSIAALAIFLILIRPFFILKNKIRKSYYIVIFSVIFLLIGICLLDWNYFNIFFSEDKQRLIFNKYVDYVVRTGFNPLFIISKLFVRAFHFTLYHSIIWIPGIIVIIGYFRKKDMNIKEGYIIFLALFMFASVFLGGARLSVHYFIPVLPVLSILSASLVYNKIKTGKFIRILFYIFIIPVLFFFIWNLKDVYIRHFNPGLKQNESRAAFLFRTVAIGSQGEYLLPHKSLVPVIDYLKTTDEKSRLMIWPMGQDIAYYSGRDTAESGYWYNESALSALVRGEAGDTKALKVYQESFINSIEKLKPDYFVDISCTTMYRKALRYRKKNDPGFYFNINEVPPLRLGSNSFGSLDDFPEIINYLNKFYIFKGSFENARVWKKSDR